MTAIWILGSHGLLGSALTRALRAEECALFAPRERLRWGNPDGLAAQLATALGEFAAVAAARKGWEVYWAAGASAMASPAESVAAETRALTLLLDGLRGAAGLAGTRGSFAFASSAGAIHAGASGAVVDETSPPTPTTPYAWAKLEQEEQVRSFAAARPETNALIARLSTLYGAGQAHGKPQGLIAHIARSLVRNRALAIYVPLDTVRDYLTADDAAAAMIAGLRAEAGSAGARLQIIAAERPTTIAEIVGVFRRLSRRAPRIVASANPLGARYPRQVQFRSLVRTDLPRPERTPLLVGIHDVLRAERAAFVAGSVAGGP
jgi:UDP-glucose 4-epimerase